MSDSGTKKPNKRKSSKKSLLRKQGVGSAKRRVLPEGFVEAYLIKQVNSPSPSGEEGAFLIFPKDTLVLVDTRTHQAYVDIYQIDLEKADYSVMV